MKVTAITARGIKSAFGPERVKTPSQTLAIISEDFIERLAHEALHTR
jgi:hypothetical protein